MQMFMGVLILTNAQLEQRKQLWPSSVNIAQMAVTAAVKLCYQVSKGIDSRF